MKEQLQAVYFDTETTGLKPGADQIIELAAYNAHTDESFVRLINPHRPIPKEASAVHKITDEMVQDAPSFKEVAEEFVEFCSGPIALIAHNNIGFDKPFIEASFKQASVAVPESWIFLDTLYWARHYRPDLPRHALQYLRKIYGFPENQAHRALDDVITLKNVFESMIDDLDISIVTKKLLELQKLGFKKR